MPFPPFAAFPLLRSILPRSLRALRPAAVVAAAAFTAGCASIPALIPKPEIKAIRPRLAGLDFQGVDLVFDVDVSNPYPAPIASPMFKYALDLGGSRFSAGDSPVMVDLPAKGTGTAALPLRLAYADVWRLSQTLAKAKEIDYTLAGNLLLNAGGKSHELPLSHSGKFPVLRLPSIKIARLRPTDIGLTRATLAVDVDMTNPNAFAMALDRIGYALNLGDVQLGELTAVTKGKIGPDETGRVQLTGEVSAMDAVRQLVGGQGLGMAKVLPTGEFQTPYGPVKFGRTPPPAP